jgi:hypothetical protein
MTKLAKAMNQSIASRHLVAVEDTHGKKRRNGNSHKAIESIDD